MVVKTFDIARNGCGYKTYEVQPVSKPIPVTDPESLEMGFTEDIFVETEDGGCGLAYRDPDGDGYCMYPNWNDDSFCEYEDFLRYREALEGSKYSLEWVPETEEIGAHMKLVAA